MRDNVTIAIIAPIQPEDFFDLLWQGVWEATFDLSSFGVEVQDLATQLQGVGEQRKILEMLLETRPDAMALLPVHASALNDLIDRHVLRGTAVITFYSDAPDSKRNAFVGCDLQQSGALAGEILAKTIGGRGRILAFPGSLHEFHLAQRYQGFRDALTRYAGIEETAAHRMVTPELIETCAPLAGYYIGNGDLVKIVSAFEQLGVRLPCVGFSNTELVRPLLERGAVWAVIDEKRYQLGYFAVQKAYEAILKRETNEPFSNVQVPSTVVFAANAGSAGNSLDGAFELLVRQRTAVLLSYKQRLEEANAKLTDLAVTDPLTGLYNRRKFEETLNHEVSRALRYGPVSLLLADLDRFKSVNDRYGHLTGDDVLKAVAKVLASSCRDTDTCARLGGDEFAVILPHCEPSAAVVVRQRIEKQIAQTAITTADGALTTRLSIGVATLPGDAGNAVALIAAADAAMYQAKQSAHEPIESSDRLRVVS
jgi:diguanylate cyclase (GGDEF)-like protein